VAGGSASLVAPQGWPAQHEGRLLIGRNCGVGDRTRDALGGAFLHSRWHLPAIIQYRTARAGATVLAVGDSLTQGVVSGNREAYAWGHYATSTLSTRARPVAFVNGGRAGQPSSVFLPFGRELLDTLRPEIVTISVWSPNGAKDRAAAEQAWEGALDLAREAEARGSIPILATAVPFNLRPGHEALREANNARARSLAARGGMLLADLDAAVADPADPATAAPPFRAPRGNHLSIEGYRACGAAAAPVIARALARLGLDARRA
jgi:lysophospholipase L1-like esterase